MYHYTENMEFTTFGKGDIGFHFGSKSQAENRGKQLKADGKGHGEGRIIQTFLDIKNPIHIPMDIMNWNAGPLAMRLYGDGIISEIEYLTILQAEKQFGSNYDSLAAVELRRILDEKGYDGVVYQNMFEGDGESYIAFYPEQVIIIDDGLRADPIDGPAYSLPKKSRGQYAIPDIAKGKSYTELDQLVKEGKITSDEAFAALGKQFGTMPKGENPKVNVTLPEKISKVKNVRQFVRNALLCEL